jgi:MSHA biogenesis protein MshN
MSVINKMLQDLDARQNGARDAANLYTKPAAIEERRVSWAAVAAAAAGVAGLAFAGAFGWRYWHQLKPQPAPSAPQAASVVVMPAPPKVTALPPASAAPVPASEPASEPARAAVPDAGEVAASAPAATVEETNDTAPQPAPHVPKRSEARKPKAKHDKHAELAAPKQKLKSVVDAAPAKAKPAVQGKEESSSQAGESAYRRGLAAMQDGYVSDAVSELERALQLNPRHDAARQTLVGLLIDNHRAEEAMQQLQLALTLDPKQPSMAMLLARLQIERGGSGIDTLTRTLPYVGANGEYHAFLAGALQRQQRHREAIDQYQAALRGLPQNGVWLMGLGISLQAEKRDGEALDAYRKAKASGTLNQQLATFVDGKIQQLSR